MKHLVLTTIAAVLLVGCGNPEADRALQVAARKGNIEAVKQHLAAGADVNAKSWNGMTPLHEAATKEVAELLIAEGADVNAKIKGGEFKGETPLDWAINADEEDNECAINLLRKHGGKTSEELKAEGN